jgi:aspartyl-tRNA(Asn)/glutamyl-tRNA(Gln) amidotransferase subunit A
MSEFGLGLQGSQAGQAIARKAADAELVLDLMGESRLAAAHAAVCGFKPSYGLISRYGLIGLIPSMECCGLLSKSVPAVRKILQAVAGPDELDFSLPEEAPPDLSPQAIDPPTTNIGVLAEAHRGLPAEQQEKFRASVHALQQAGFRIREVSLPDFPLFSLVHNIVGSVEASSCAGRYDSVRYGSRPAGAKNWNEMYLLARGAAFGPLLKSYLFQGAFFQFENYEAYEDACRIRARLLADVPRMTAQTDFLMLPAVDGATVGAAASLADTYAQFACTLFANVTGQPALYLPPGSGAAQAGFQLAGPRLCDGRLLALGEHLLSLRQGGK